MARTMFRDVGGGRRRGYARLMTSAFCLLLISMMAAGCDLDDLTSPNTSNELTGQTTNQQFTFSGTIGVTSFTATVSADDSSTVTITATVKDDSGNPIQNLTTVNFNADMGGFVVGLNTDGSNLTATSATATTFNGLAQVDFQSVNRETGTATITASVGSTVASTKVKLEPAAIRGTISLAWGVSGTGSVLLSGVATEAAPLEANVGAAVMDFEGNPILGAIVKFRILSDTTDDMGGKSAEWVADSTTATGSTGTAVNILRVFGAGDVTVEARVIDPITEATVTTSNRIILTTKTTSIATLSFAAGGASFTAVAPYTTGITVMVADTEGNPQEGLQVRLTIQDDSTSAGASLSSSVGITDATGIVTSSVSVPDNGGGPGSSVSILAEVVDSAGTVLATSNVIVAAGT